MKKQEHWTDQLEKCLSKHDNVFGHNCEVNIKNLLHTIDVTAMGSSKIEIDNEYTIKITLPPKTEYREQILLRLLTVSPMPTEVKYNKAKDKLTIEWHY